MSVEGITKKTLFHCVDDYSRGVEVCVNREQYDTPVLQLRIGDEVVFLNGIRGLALGHEIANSLLELEPPTPEQYASLGFEHI